MNPHKRIDRAVWLPLLWLTLSVSGAGCKSDSVGNGDTATCEEVCPDVVAEGCLHSPATVDDCELECEDSALTCPAEHDDVVDCAGPEPTYSCNAHGIPYPDGCLPEHDVLMGCLNGVPPFCWATCPDVVDEGCSAGPSDVDDCLTGCTHAATTCPAEFDAVRLCAGESPTFSCDASDAVYPDGCDDAQADLNACLGI